MPFARGLSALGTDVVLDSGDYAGLLDKALTAMKWDELQSTLRRRRANGERWGRASRVSSKDPDLSQGRVRLSLDASGAVELVTGGASLGRDSRL